MAWVAVCVATGLAAWAAADSDGVMWGTQKLAGPSWVKKVSVLKTLVYGGPALGKALAPVEQRVAEAGCVTVSIRNMSEHCSWA